MTESAFRFCPECREEYTPTTERCAECDVALVGAGELPDEPEPEAFEFPEAADLCCVRVAPLPWIRALSNALEEREVPHRVEPATADAAPEGQRPELFGDVDLFGLYVLDDDVAGAGELDALIAQQVLPDEAPDVGEGEAEACPACGAALAHDAVECGDCGLPFG